MKLLKEILYLVSLLIFTFPGRYRLLETQKLHYFPITSRGWMMWCGVLVHRREFEQWEKDKCSWMRMNIRLYQAKTHHFTWTTFYLSYWLDMLIGSLVCYSWRGGYYTSPYVIEEYAKEEDNYYLYDYGRENMEKYRFHYSERKTLWKEIEGNVEKWIEYIKEI
jgi:hypothetical protein